jgi:hypothetical protein
MYSFIRRTFTPDDLLVPAQRVDVQAEPCPPGQEPDRQEDDQRDQRGVLHVRDQPADGQVVDAGGGEGDRLPVEDRQRDAGQQRQGPEGGDERRHLPVGEDDAVEDADAEPEGDGDPDRREQVRADVVDEDRQHRAGQQDGRSDRQVHAARDDHQRRAQRRQQQDAGLAGHQGEVRRGQERAGLDPEEDDHDHEHGQREQAAQPFGPAGASWPGVLAAGRRGDRA